MKVRGIFACLLACAATAAVSTASPASWVDVPFVAQTRDGCGSASISMVMKYWERQAGQASSDTADAGHIQAALYSKADRGISAARMRDYFLSVNFRAFAFAGNWETLKRHLERGRPLIVALQASGPLEPLHYVVVAGIDVEQNFIYLNDPSGQKMLRMSREGFEAEWNPTHDWTLLAVPSSAN